ncbi:hypothetical protein E2C01_058837 [Portunus trituberculatus]|uniref:Uncharacterized protein n=1 Tax=Portunus trituberculatus TaxID=210409 RepID=A0A5B7H5T0_PORTR|nr:hypothetical protein [Portunus trituberculatus]
MEKGGRGGTRQRRCDEILATTAAASGIPRANSSGSAQRGSCEAQPVSVRRVSAIEQASPTRPRPSGRHLACHPEAAPLSPSLSCNLQPRRSCSQCAAPCTPLPAPRPFHGQDYSRLPCPRPSQVSDDDRNGHTASPGDGKTRGVRFPTRDSFEKGNHILINGH